MGGGGVIVLYIKYVISVIIFLVYIYYILLFRISREAPASSALGTTSWGGGARGACHDDEPKAFPESTTGARTVYKNVLYSYIMI